MSKLPTVLLCLVVTVLQLILWNATERRSQVARRLAGGGQASGVVTRAAGEIVSGRSQFVVRYEFAAPTGKVQGEEFLSMRQAQQLKSGDKVNVYYDAAEPELNTLSNPREVLQRMATMKLLTLGFGAFTYAFVYVIWRSSRRDQA
jgi:hypothetical protein